MMMNRASAAALPMLSVVLLLLLFTQTTLALDEPGTLDITNLLGPPIECPLVKCRANCDNGYVIDEAGCQTCRCIVVPADTDNNVKIPALPLPMECPMVKCRANCDNGYVIDSNGCRTCRCLPEPLSPRAAECSPFMCRMFCQNGFRQDANGCNICSCADTPSCPLLKCAQQCPNGYRTDARGCATCDCACPPPVCPSAPNGGNCSSPVIQNGIDGCPVCTCLDNGRSQCPQLKCREPCKYGYANDAFGCPLCTCNRCPLPQCRMYCMYGFKRNADGCEICACDFQPLSGNVDCSEREPCPNGRICNMGIAKCETVPRERIQFFIYNFNVKSEYLNDRNFLQAFKNGLIQNIAMKYALLPAQIQITAVEKNLIVSFQIMPYYTENMEEFNRKLEQIDVDLNTARAFDSVLPLVARKGGKHPSSILGFNVNRQRILYVIAAVLIGLTTLLFTTCFIVVFRRRVLGPRSDSKSPIFGYEQAPSEDDQYHAVHAPDGTAYVVVESEDMEKASDKRALV